MTFIPFLSPQHAAQTAEQRAFAYLFALLPVVMKANFIERVK